jgi:hypothetical protein
MAEKNGSHPAPSWASFKPPPLPEQEKLDAVLKKLAGMTPEQIVQKSVATGIHSALGHGLTEQYRPPPPAPKKKT